MKLLLSPPAGSSSDSSRSSCRRRRPPLIGLRLPPPCQTCLFCTTGTIKPLTRRPHLKSSPADTLRPPAVTFSGALKCVWLYGRYIIISRCPRCRPPTLSSEKRGRLLNIKDTEAHLVGVLFGPPRPGEAR